MLCDSACPYQLPEASWAMVSNDSMFLPSDDGYTAGAGLSLRGDRWVATTEYRMLTDRRCRTRTDQLGLSFGTTTNLWQCQWEPWAGVSVTGNLGGQRLQDSWHHSKNIGELPCEYDSRYRALPMAGVSGRLDEAWGSLRLLGGGIGRSAFLEPSIGTGGEAGVIRVGWRMSWGQDTASHTIRCVEADARGPFLTMGLNAGLCASFTFSGHACWWSVGATW